MNSHPPAGGTELRRRAQERFQARPAPAPGLSSPEENQRLLHELQVHQIELEMQNEELVEARGRAEEAAALYTEIYDFAPLAYFTLDRHGRITQANLAAAHLIGVDRQRLPGARFRDYVAPAGSPIFDASLERVLGGQAGQTCEVALVTGDRVHLLARISVCLAPDGRECHLQVEDITELVRTATALRHFGAMVESSDDAIISEDLAGQILSWNPAAGRIFGYPAQEALGRSISMLVPPAISGEVQVLLAASKRGESARLYHTTRLRKDGQTINVSLTVSPIKGSNGQVIGACTIARDITAILRAEQAIRNSEAELAAIYDSSPLMLCLINEDRELERINRTMVECGGGQLVPGARPHPGDILGCVNTLADPGGCGFGSQCGTCKLRQALVTTFETGRPFHQLEMELVVVRGGVRKPIVISASTALVELPDQRRILLCMEDVTHRAQLQDQFLHAQKSEVLGQLAGGMAHDFNNILAAILLELGLLGTSPSLDPQARDGLANVMENTERAAAVVRQLLLFCRRSVMAMKPVDLNEALASLVKMLGKLISENILLRYEPCEGPALVKGDLGLIQQVVTNLVLNARDAITNAGRIAMTLTPIEADAERVLGRAGVSPGRFLCLSVSDSGSGMDAATLKHIFEPYFTTKPVGKGTGLGLAAVTGIVAQHKGWLEVESEPGQGATFKAFFPAATEPAGGPVRATSRVPGRGHEQILFVEDEAGLRRLVARALRDLGYTVVEAADGHEARKVWREHRGCFDLLVSDMIMPEGVSGLDLAATFRGEKPGLKIIISSGYTPEMTEETTAAPHIAYLPKPYDIESLGRAVRECLDQE